MLRIFQRAIINLKGWLCYKWVTGVGFKMKRGLDVSRKSKTPSRTLKRYVNICTSSLHTMRGVCVCVFLCYTNTVRTTVLTTEATIQCAVPRYTSCGYISRTENCRVEPSWTESTLNTHVTSSPPLCVVTIDSDFVPSIAFHFYFQYTLPDNLTPPCRQGTGLLEVYRTWYYVFGYVISINHFTHR